MESWIVSFVSAWGMAGIFLLMFLENIIPVIPSEPVLLLAGALAASQGWNFLWLLALSVLISVAGACVLYLLGRWMDVERLSKLLDHKIFRILRLKPESLEKANAWFEKYDSLAVFVCRFIPVVRALISLPAGMAHMNIGKFIILTAAGSLIWNAALIGCGMAVGNAWDTILPIIQHYVWLFALLAIALLGGYIILKRYRRKTA